MNKSNFKQIFLTLALLITAATGAWAAEETLLVTINASDNTTFTSGSKTFDDKVTLTFEEDEVFGNDGTGWYKDAGSPRLLTLTPTDGVTITCVKLFNAVSSIESTSAPFIVGFESGSFSIGENNLSGKLTKIEVYGTAPVVEPPLEVTLNTDNTVATMTMPESDVTVEYELVRDMIDETNPVEFGGLPASGDIIVKKGDDGKYQPASELTITLIDPLAAADAQNIIASEDINIQVIIQKENAQGAIDDDPDSEPITLEAFLADMQPGYYRLKAVASETGAYDGTVYSVPLTLVEKYDLALQPADDFSKDKLSEVTVAGAAQTLDADGKATVPTESGKEVKLKAKRGYVIDKVEAKKGAGPEGVALGESTVGMIVGSDGLAYAAADKDNLPKGVTVAAKVCYVDGNGHGLALALADEGSMNWSTAQTTCAAHTPTITGGTWKLATKDEWSNMITAAGSHTALRDGFSSVGGTNMQSDFYWSSTTISYGAWYYTFDGGSWTNGSKSSLQYVRACLAF